MLYKLEWPDHSVCEMTNCPQEAGYCLECHCTAYNAMLQARRWIVGTLVALGRTP